ncbi:hypothetical protein M422DRAFT_52351 [Sphaerobolus stellatus SS14]|uniref:Unplaced genomic scaffold SPHSTscaffold_135, whole genome shotgun sequence n=1 Tax=Sphaerobolus stellatus (strain SS14) TaxID=990650 RepID=A0A0C9UWI8_SPHS4|nr:hypothetical protein M422DRAFT_52351 [Sphaerobolus stellatus SS14]
MYQIYIRILNINIYDRLKSITCGWSPSVDEAFEIPTTTSVHFMRMERDFDRHDTEEMHPNWIERNRSRRTYLQADAGGTRKGMSQKVTPTNSDSSTPTANADRHRVRHISNQLQDLRTSKNREIEMYTLAKLLSTCIVRREKGVIIGAYCTMYGRNYSLGFL